MSKEKTESVKISKVIMDEVRKKKEETGIPLIRIIERAIQNDLIQKPVTENKDGAGR